MGSIRHLGLLALALGLAAAHAQVAIVDVTVLPMDAERQLEGHTVIVREGRIERMGPTAEVTIPSGVHQIDGRGRFLMPGLVDMHVHLTPTEGNPPLYEDNEASLALLVAHGVTTVRNLWGTPSILALRKRVRAGDLLGPHIVTSGPLVEGRPMSLRGTPWSPVELATRPLTIYVDTPEDAREAVRYHAHAGYDLIKVYDGIPETAYWALVQEAEVWGLSVVGHVPSAVGLASLLTRRPSHATVEHADAFARLAEADASPARSETDPLVREPLQMVHASADKLTLLAELAAARGLAVTPTLLIADRMRGLPSRTDSVLASPAAGLTSARQRGAWRSRAAGVPTALAQQGVPLDSARVFAFALARALDGAGARLLLGTDAPTSVAPQGVAVHDELALFVEAGLTPYRALRAATVSAHAVLSAAGLSEASGQSAGGEPADLLLLRADPFHTIHAVRRLEGVVLAGRWLDADALAALQASAEAAYAP